MTMAKPVAWPLSYTKVLLVSWLSTWICSWGYTWNDTFVSLGQALGVAYGKALGDELVVADGEALSLALGNTLDHTAFY